MAEGKAEEMGAVFEDWFVEDLETQMPAAVRRHGFKAVIAREKSGRAALLDGLFPFDLMTMLHAGAWAKIEFSANKVRVLVSAKERAGSVVVAEATTFGKAIGQFEKWEKEAKAARARLWEEVAGGRDDEASYICELYGRDAAGETSKATVSFVAPEGALATVSLRGVRDVRDFGVVGNDTAICGPERITALPFASVEDLVAWFSDRFEHISPDVREVFG